jgi:hypothetical protein
MMRDEPGRRKRNLRTVFLVLAVLAAIGWAIGYIAGPFVFILYIQFGTLVLAAFVFFSVRKDLFLLPAALAWLAAYILKQSEISAALAALFLIAFAGRNVIADPRRRRRFSLAAIAGVGLAFIVFLVFFRVTGESTLVSAAARAEAIKSLPYASFDPQEKEKRDGVIEYRKEASDPGLNLYNSYYQPGAVLLDMDGHVLHRWRPESGGPHWHFVRLLSNGDLLVCVEDEMMMRLDWNSRVLWKTPMRTHHDIAVAANGDIYTLTGAEEMVTLRGVRAPVINEYIDILDGSTGTLKRRLSLFDLFRREISPAAIGRIYGQILDPQDYFWRAPQLKRKGRPILRRLTGFDIFHANALKLIDRTIEGVCREGDLLVSLRALDGIAVIDPVRGALRWIWGPGEIEEPHDPSLLEDGRILVFDNGTRRKFSRVVEFDPRTRSIVWEYHDLGAVPFYSSWGGAAQRLFNGNTLITESDAGRVFEVTRGGEKVWVYMNPDDGAGGKRATIYRMTRIVDPGAVAAMRRLAGRD